MNNMLRKSVHFFSNMKSDLVSTTIIPHTALMITTLYHSNYPKPNEVRLKLWLKLKSLSC